MSEAKMIGYQAFRYHLIFNMDFIDWFFGLLFYLFGVVVAIMGAFSGDHRKETPFERPEWISWMMASLLIVLWTLLCASWIA